MLLTQSYPLIFEVPFVTVSRIQITEQYNYKYDFNNVPGYFYGSEKGLLRDKPPTPHQAMLMPENLFKPAKYNCTECTSEFHLLGDLIEHRSRFHGPAERYVNGEPIRPQSQDGTENANTAVNSTQYGNEHTSSSEVKIEPKKENECESEDEQIDVVTTKVEEDSSSKQNETN